MNFREQPLPQQPPVCCTLQEYTIYHAYTSEAKPLTVVIYSDLRDVYSRLPQGL